MIRWRDALLRADRRKPAAATARLGARAAFTAGQQAGLLAATALLIALRLPHAWAQGRFLDEEGTIFLAFAWHHPAGEALWRAFGGYLNLAANATALVTARLVRWQILPLEFAPYLTMTVALLGQLLPAVLLVTGRAGWLAQRSAVVAALLLLVVLPASEEVFFNILHIQFHLALCTGLILALDPPATRGGRCFSALLLFLAPLCGPGAIVLAPFFVLRALIESDRARLMQAAILAAGAAVQMSLFLAPSPARGHLLDPAMVVALLFVRLVALPLLGWPIADKLGGLLHAAQAGEVARGWWWFGVAGGLVYFGLLIALARRGRRDPALWLISAGLTIAIVSFGGGSIGMGAREWFSVGAGERYNFLPLALITFGLIALAARPGGDHRRAAACLCLLTLLSGAFSYTRPIAEVSRGAPWRDEVAAWRRDHEHRLISWPSTWTIDLSDRDRPCTPPGKPPQAPEPDYCEGAWLARAVRAPHGASAPR